MDSVREPDHRKEALDQQFDRRVLLRGRPDPLEVLALRHLRPALLGQNERRRGLGNPSRFLGVMSSELPPILTHAGPARVLSYLATGKRPWHTC